MSYPNLKFEKVIREHDYEYAIDYEVYREHKCLFAIQIKPLS